MAGTLGRLTQPEVRSSPTDFRSPRVLVPVVVLTALVTLGGLTLPAPPMAAQLAVLAVVLAVIGIPHGALDHAVAAETAAATGRRFDLSTFQLRYLAAMAGYGGIWLLSPRVALVVFALASVHHFGQSDLAPLRIGGLGGVAASWSRGVLVVGALLVTAPADAWAVVTRLGVEVEPSQPTTWPWLAVLGAQHLLVLGGLGDRLARSQRRREVVATLSLVALFAAAPPLLAFAVYFGAWHSLNHALVLVGHVRPDGSSSPWRQAIRLALPRTAVSLAGLIALTAGLWTIGRPELTAPAIVVTISLLTLPHLVVVEQLWRRPTAPPLVSAIR